MKITNIIQIHVSENHENHRNLFEKNENHENLINSCKKLKKENHLNPYETHENHENLKVHVRIMKIMKIIEINLRITKVMKIIEIHVIIIKINTKFINPYEHHANLENIRIP